MKNTPMMTFIWKRRKNNMSMTMIYIYDEKTPKMICLKRRRRDIKNKVRY